METNYKQLEVLLMTGTTFTSGAFCKATDSPREETHTKNEQLEEACWEGLVQSMLPEICWQPNDGSILYLWRVNEASSFLELELGEVPLPIDRLFSINPYVFLSSQLYN